jgi:hypothetical protein
MRRRLFSQRYRPVAAVIAVIVLFVAAFAFPQVRAIASNFLGLFRVDQIRVVEVNPVNLPERLGSSTSLESLLAEDIQLESFGERRMVETPEEAHALTDVPVRLPESVDGKREIWVQPGSRVTYHTDMDRLAQILKELGRTDIQIPDGLEDATITFSVPDSVVTNYGPCEFEGEDGFDPDESSLKDCTTFVQMPSPTVSAPDGLDMVQIGRAFLQIMGMSQEEAEAFSQNVDWATTLVIPIPRYRVDYQQVQVDGVEGTLMQQKAGASGPQFVLLWVKDGVVHALTGQGEAGEALTIARSLQ